MMPLLCRDALAAGFPRAVTVPGVHPARTGIVHLGIGAFARAHPVLFTELAAEAAGDPRWGVLGVTGRSPEAAAVLERQQGVYGVMSSTDAGPAVRLVGALTGVAPIHDRQRVIDAIASPETSVVTLTVTEKAYAADGQLMRVLMAGLRARHAAGGHPLSVLSCDNLPSNGMTLRGVLRSPVVDGAFERWLESHVATPSSMVDRITPAATDADRAAAAELTGFRDEALVVAEPFSQWVIEDRFLSSRPEWERAGVQVVSDVASYELAKLRLLNGTHTLLACAGAVRGFDTVAEAIGDPVLLGWCRRWQDDVSATLPIDLRGRAYADSILERFANPGLRHTTRQIARDTSQKIDMRILRAARERLAAGAAPIGAAFAVGAWLAFLWSEVRAGRELDDPRAVELAGVVAAAGSDPGLAAVALLGLFGPPWPGSFTSRVALFARGIVRDDRRNGHSG